MRIVFQISFSKKARNKADQIKSELIIGLIPIILKGLRIIEVLAVMAAILAACSMESVQIIPVIRTFVSAIIVLIIAQFAYAGLHALRRNAIRAIRQDRLTAEAFCHQKRRSGTKYAAYPNDSHALYKRAC